MSYPFLAIDENSLYCEYTNITIGVSAILVFDKPLGHLESKIRAGALSCSDRPVEPLSHVRARPRRRVSVYRSELTRLTIVKWGGLNGVLSSNGPDLYACSRLP